MKEGKNGLYWLENQTFAADLHLDLKWMFLKQQFSFLFQTSFFLFSPVFWLTKKAQKNILLMNFLLDSYLRDFI